MLINSRNLFLTFLKPGSLTSGCWHGQVLVRVLFWIADCHLFLVTSRGGEQREEASSLMTVTKALIPFLRAPSI